MMPPHHARYYLGTSCPQHRGLSTTKSTWEAIWYDAAPQLDLLANPIFYPMAYRQSDWTISFEDAAAHEYRLRRNMYDYFVGLKSGCRYRGWMSHYLDERLGR